MSIKPAMGWLALLLFTTAAQAGGAEVTRGIIKKAPPVQVVTAKTKAPPVTRTAAGAPRGLSLTLSENVRSPKADYEAEIYSAVPLDDALAKGRGFERGLVSMVFEKTRRATFRVGRDHIKRQLRFTSDETAPGTLAQRARVDVLDTDQGIIVVDTQTLPGGMFTTSDVYVFAETASLDKRVGVLEASVGPTPTAKERVRQALVAAEWAPAPK